MGGDRPLPSDPRWRRVDGIPGAPPDFNELYFTLVHDLLLARRALDAAPADEVQAWRRAYVRAAVTLLEGLTNWTAHAAVDLSRSALDGSPMKLTALQECALGEVAPLIKDGQATAREASHGFANRYRLVMNCWAQVLEVAYEFPSGDARWQDLRNTVDLRNRLTHPRSGASLHVTDVELAAVDRALAFNGDAAPRLPESDGESPPS